MSVHFEEPGSLSRTCRVGGCGSPSAVELHVDGGSTTTCVALCLCHFEELRGAANHWSETSPGARAVLMLNDMRSAKIEWLTRAAFGTRGELEALLEAEKVPHYGHEGARAIVGCVACTNGSQLDTGVMRHDLDPVSVAQDGYGTGCPACRRLILWPRRVRVFPCWLRGLERWPGALLRAAVAAEYLAWKASCRCSEGGHAIGCFVRLQSVRFHDEYARGVPKLGGVDPDEWGHWAEDAASTLGEECVRRAIRADLVAWALS